ncbi:MAG: signal recognition particle-docking protein FtsY [Clostridiales bacterium]|nr:signal recognition particle-docking protein FtsY [Clostridiales bacterium]
MEKQSLLGRLRMGLTKTRDALTGRIDELIHYYREIDDDFYDELTDILIAADIGISTATALVSRLREQVRRGKIGRPDEIRGLLRTQIAESLGPAGQWTPPAPGVILMVGVNGTGKTTTAGKLAARFKAEGKSVLLAAADTFRAAAAEQLCLWGERAGVRVVRHEEGSDPAAVLYDALDAARAHAIDLVICDTAGRLHTKKNLMSELEKIERVVERGWPEAGRESLLVVDATTGQNAIAQARLFSECVRVTGIVLTKLDGTAKGGVAVALSGELSLPVRFIGVGEAIDDLQPFDAEAFAGAIIG